MIELVDVSKVYVRADGPVTALAGISLRIENGEFVAVRGPSGCGKSTLLTLIGGLGTPTGGRVLVAGEDLTSMSSGERARFRAHTIGFVFQTFHLLPYLTVLDNVVAAAPPGEASVARQRARSLLEQFRLSHRMAHHPAELSTGECQRAAIARALVNRPKLILADEPTGNLDTTSGTDIMGVFLDLWKSGSTLVVITHDMALARRASRIVEIRDGRIVSDRAAEEAA